MHFDIARARVCFPTEGQCSYLSHRAVGVSLFSIYIYTPSSNAFLYLSSLYLFLASQFYLRVPVRRSLLRHIVNETENKDARDISLHREAFVGLRVLPSCTSHPSNPPRLPNKKVCLCSLVLHCDLCGSSMPYGTTCPVLEWRCAGDVVSHLAGQDD